MHHACAQLSLACGCPAVHASTIPRASAWLKTAFSSVVGCDLCVWLFARGVRALGTCKQDQEGARGGILNLKGADGSHTRG